MATYRSVPTARKQSKQVLFLILLLSFLIALAGGCGAAPKVGGNGTAPTAAQDWTPREEAENQASADTAASHALSGVAGNIEDAVVARKVIRNADLTISVKDVHSAANTVIQMAETVGGMVSDSSISQSGDRMSGSIQLRLPAHKFDTFIVELAKLGEIIYQRTYSQDVTEEFIDLEAKIKNLESQEQTLRKLITESDNVADLLAVEKELARVRSEIDSLKGRLRYLSDRVDLSTIHITLKELSPFDRRIAASSLSGLGKRSLQAFIRGTNLVVELLTGLIVFLVGAIPVLVFLAVAALVVRYPLKWLRDYFRKRKNGRQEQ